MASPRASAASAATQPLSSLSISTIPSSPHGASSSSSINNAVSPASLLGASGPPATSVLSPRLQQQQQCDNIPFRIMLVTFALFITWLATRHSVHGVHIAISSINATSSLPIAHRHAHDGSDGPILPTTPSTTIIPPDSEPSSSSSSSSEGTKAGQKRRKLKNKTGDKNKKKGKKSAPAASD
jgi:hypothetical protein